MKTKRFIVANGVLACAWPTIAVGDVIPPPGGVPGKEYSNHVDIDSFGVADPGQVLNWDSGPAPLDTFDYFAPGVSGQVDALANSGDAFFNEVTTDTVSMLASFAGVGDIHYTHHGPGLAHAGAVGVWATGPVDINANPAHADVDGLEIWGAPGPGGDDADNYSLIGDPGGTAVWKWTVPAGPAVPFISSLEIATAIGRTDLAADLDLDAMMILGDRIMFSIAPIDVFDGGEIWVHTIGAGPAPFLVHGGEPWNTAHIVSGAGGHFLGAISENINALEAVPEPGSLALLAFGGLMLVRRRR